MAYVNVFIEAWNENRQVSVGGRRTANSGGIRINTANQNGESAIKVRAEVMGNTSSRDRRKYGDNRESRFTVELPERNPAVKVRIVQHGHSMDELLRFGAALCMVKGLTEVEENPEHAKEAMRFGIETLAELEAEIGKNLPDVELPGGVTLAHAMACVKIVAAMKEGKDTN